MKKITAFAIEWETDGEKVDLPEIVTGLFPDDFFPETELSDALSDEFGFCINSLMFAVGEYYGKGKRVRI
jgi:hypothetical protein